MYKTRDEMIRTYPPTSKGRGFEKWTEGIAVLRKLEVELTETLSQINKLQTATWVGNGVEIEILGTPDTVRERRLLP